MVRHHIDKGVSEFAHKNISTARNVKFGIVVVLLVLVCAAQSSHSVHSEAKTPDADTVFYRIDTSIRRLQDDFYKRGLRFLRKKKAKLAKRKCYLTVDETHDSYTGGLHKKPFKELTPEQKTVRRYIHSYKPKAGDRGSFKYLVFALVYGKKKRVLRVIALRRKEPYWLLVAATLKELYVEVKFECALLDRGFYVAELINQLGKDGTPFVIRARLCDTMRFIYGLYTEWKAYDYAVADWAWTTLVLGRDLHGRPWGFVTNLDVDYLGKLYHLYKKRWNIENIFKATDGIQLRAATNNHITRLFCVCLSFLIYNAWQQRNKKPTLLDHVKQLLATLLKAVMSVCPWRDKLKLNNPFWQFIQPN